MSDLLLLEEVDSTNEFAKSQVNVHNTLVIAAAQTAGKGRDGRRFESQRGGLYMSLVRLDGFAVAECARYYLAAPLAVCTALADRGVNARIKWPNDVWVDNKKIAGILVETSLKNGTVQKAVVGIGVNVNNNIDNVPCPATSMFLQGVHMLPRRLGVEIAVKLDEYLRLSAQELVYKVKELCLTLGKTVVFCDGSEGVAVDLAADGRLVVECGGERVYVAAGDVTIKDI